MKLKYAFKRTITNSSASARQETKPEVPDGMLKKCNACKGAVFVDEVKKNNYICPHCGNYFRIHARRRIEMIADEGTFEEWDSVMPINNPLSYKGYPDKVKKLQEKTGLDEAIVTGRAKIGGVSAVSWCMRQPFSHGKHGRKCRRKNCHGQWKKLRKKGFLWCCLPAPEGARMQEGIVSLNADGQDLCGLKKTQRCRASLHQCSDQSNHRRGDGKLCHAGGYYSWQNQVHSLVLQGRESSSRPSVRSFQRAFRSQNFFWNTALSTRL